MIYVTGDKHGDYNSIRDFCYKHKTTREDTLIVLGDAGINYYLDNRDYILKNSLLQLNITLFCIHGNHEERPENINTYKKKIYKDGIVYYEEDYPNILFAKDGEIYDFDGKQTIVIGGAYSVDKEYRLLMGYKWYKSEQPSAEIKQRVLTKLKENNNKIDIILSHTCPYKYIPYEVFLGYVEQSTVDNTTEKYLDIIEGNIEYKRWYCGHYHTEKIIDKIKFMYDNIEVL